MSIAKFAANTIAGQAVRRGQQCTAKCKKESEKDKSLLIKISILIK